MFNLKLSDGSPKINFENCHLLITGNSYNLDVGDIYSNIQNKIGESTCDNVTVDIELDICNSNTILQLNKILQLIRNKFKKFSINWSSDEDFESQVLERISGVKVNFLQRESV